MKTALVVLFTLLVTVFGQKKTFQATFIIKNDPNIIGNMIGTINYVDEGATTNQIIRNDYKLPGGDISEVFDYKNDLRSLKCTVCETTTSQAQFPIFYQVGNNGGATVVVNGISCKQWNINDNVVTRVFISEATGDIIRAEFKLETGAVLPKTIDFSNHKDTVDKSVFNIASWNCPPRKCTKMMDIMLVFDESGSIDPADFRKEIDFGASLADNYNFGPDGVQMGFVKYGDNAQLVSTLTATKSNFVNLVRATNQRKGQTCTACGMWIAYQELTSSRGRSKATKVMITLTDGQSNTPYQGRNLAEVAPDVKGRGVISFGIGVGKGVKVEEITLIASQISGVNTAFPSIPDFASLKGITEQLVIATCVDIPGTPCGAGCRGFCTCQGKCVCPSDCNDNNNCTVEACKESVNGAGCFYSDTCDPKAKCTSTSHPDGQFCNDFNACTDEICDPIVGCIWTNVTCPKKARCIDSYCNTALGCQEKPVDCLITNPRLADLIRTCFLVECNEEKGCHTVPINGTGIDDCGVCNGTNACKAPPLPESVPYALTGGALAAVLIFAIAAAAALGAAGGKAGYNVWMNHRNHISGAQTSPLYNDNGLTGASPLYKA